MTFGLWSSHPGRGSIAAVTGQMRYPQHWLFAVGALVEYSALGWPVARAFLNGDLVRKLPIDALWFVPFGLFGATMLVAMLTRLPARVYWTLIALEVALVMAMALILPWAGMSEFLVIVAWQAAIATTAPRAIGWVLVQTAAVVGALAQALNPDLCWVITKSFAVQLLLVFAAQALRRQAQTAAALTETNRELRAAQAVIASSVRDAERLRISRELHDAWGHELTALGLQLEIASHVTEPAKANAHVVQAKGLARDLLAKVRDVVSTLREAERGDLRDALEALAASVPRPAIHVSVARGLTVNADQAHALMRCAQEAVTNAVRHADAANLWLDVAADGDGVRLVARDDGHALPASAAPGSGLVGMRERVESLGGRLAVRADAGFTVDAWLPARSPQIA